MGERREEASDPRFGLPAEYQIKLSDHVTRKVHWSRIIHYAEVIWIFHLEILLRVGPSNPAALEKLPEVAERGVAPGSGDEREEGLSEDRVVLVAGGVDHSRADGVLVLGIGRGRNGGRCRPRGLARAWTHSPCSGQVRRTCSRTPPGRLVGPLPFGRRRLNPAPRGAVRVSGLEASGRNGEAGDSTHQPPGAVTLCASGPPVVPEAQSTPEPLLSLGHNYLILEEKDGAP